jgi:hypothetical protein
MVVRCPTPRERSSPVPQVARGVGSMMATDEPAPRDRQHAVVVLQQYGASSATAASSMPACSSNGAGAPADVCRARVAAVIEPSSVVLVEDAGDGAVEGRGVGRVERRRGRVDERLERRRRQVVAEELLVQSTEDVGGGVRGAVVGPDPAGEPELRAKHILQPEGVLTRVRRRLLQARYLVLGVGAHDRAGPAISKRGLVGPEVQLVAARLVHHRRGFWSCPL